MKIKQSGFSFYSVISIVAFIALVFILLLPQQFDLDEAKKRDQSIENMKQIYQAVEKYMQDRQVDFVGDIDELVKAGYLKKNFTVPGGKPGDRYFAEGKYANFDITVKPPEDVLLKYPDHVLE